MAGDIDAAYAWLTSQAGVDKTRMAAAGASCGANQSVHLARRHPEVRTVVLLSGAIAPDGREFIRDSAWLPIFGAASHGDGGAVGCEQRIELAVAHPIKVSAPVELQFTFAQSKNRRRGLENDRVGAVALLERQLLQDLSILSADGDGQRF